MSLYPDFPIYMLTEHFNSLVPLTADDLVVLRQRRNDVRCQILDEGIEIRRELSLAIDPPETAFAKPGSDNDLDEQLSVLTRNFGTYIRTGWDCPPHAAWRVAVILRRMKRADLERAFLEAWVRHFPWGPGSRFVSLVERAEKMGIIVAEDGPSH